MVRISEYQINRLRIVFNVFETADMAVFHSYDFGLQGFQMDTQVKEDFIQQLQSEGIIYKSLEFSPEAIILRRK